VEAGAARRKRMGWFGKRAPALGSKTQENVAAVARLEQLFADGLVVRVVEVAAADERDVGHRAGAVHFQVAAFGVS
jgi:hypothetical protein